LVAIVTYGVLSSSGVVQKEGLSLGGAIVGFLVSVYMLNKVYGKVSPSDAGASPLEAHERSISIIQDADQITTQMVAAVQKAKQYIYAIGGQSRNKAYLDALTKRVKRQDVRYIRVVTGDHIRHPLCKHLQDLQDLVEIGYQREQKFGGILVTDEVTIMALPSPDVSILDRALIIKDPSMAADYRAYVAEVFGGAGNIDIEFVRNLCETCRQSPV